METINNVASAASKAIWGDSTTQNNETAGKEPISGEQGKGTTDSPFDQGNSETATDPDNKPIGQYNNSTSSNTGSSIGAPTGATETSGSKMPNNPEASAVGGETKPLEDHDKTGVTSKTGDPPKGSDVVPSESTSNTGAPSGGITHQKQQGADRPTESPEEAETRKGEEALKNRDPNDHSGEPMRMHNESEEKKVPETQEERRHSKVGNPGGQEHGAGPKGTGEKHIKTSGLQADGGDFDATKPGAGREADRLLEEKGIHKTDSNKGPPVETQSNQSNESGEKKEKVSTVDKIKGKLHIGHKDK